MLCCSALFNQPCVFGASDGFEARVGVELAKNMLDVIADGCAADMQLIGDTRRRCSPGKQAQDLSLALSEVGGTCRGSRRTEQSAGLFRRQVSSRDDEIPHQRF